MRIQVCTALVLAVVATDASERIIRKTSSQAATWPVAARPETLVLTLRANGPADPYDAMETLRWDLNSLSLEPADRQRERLRRAF